jgi:hypothetical protein
MEKLIKLDWYHAKLIEGLLNDKLCVIENNKLKNPDEMHYQIIHKKFKIINESTTKQA